MLTNYKKFLYLIGNILVILSLLFIFKILIDNYHIVMGLEFNFYTLSIFLLLIMLSIFVYILFSISWVAQLKSNYPSFNFILSFYIISLSQIGKYLPGNIGHFAGRFYLSKRFLSKQDIIYTISVENILFICISFLLGSIYILYIDITKYITLFELLFSFLLLFSLIVFSFLAIKYIRKKITIINLNYATMIKVFFIFIIMSLLGGLSIYILTLFIAEDSNISYLQCLSGFSLSFLIGFIIPGAPGGIGIREYSFVLLFSPFLGEIYALKIILTFRIITVLSDILLFLIGKVLSKKIKNKVNNNA